jgi:hydroxymethylbilane synthase
MTVPASFTAQNPLRIGTRRSPLALAQAHMTASAIRILHGLADGAVVLVPMLSSGDKIQDRPLAELGGKALWTKELERALLDGEIDIAVHSMKDVETIRADSFCIAAMLPRADVRDRLIGAASISQLPVAAKIGTSSPRRAAQILALRPDVTIASIRGNVATRISQIEAGDFDATLLAAAGLDRLSMADTGTTIETDEMLPAASQGAIGIDALCARGDILDLLEPINHRDTFECVMAERAFLAALGGSCHSPVAALAVKDGVDIFLRGEIYSEDGTEKQAGEARMPAGQYEASAKLAADLLARAGPSITALFAL